MNYKYFSLGQLVYLRNAIKKGYGQIEIMPYLDKEIYTRMPDINNLSRRQQIKKNETKRKNLAIKSIERK